jgi:hypothetical protein
LRLAVKESDFQKQPGPIAMKRLILVVAGFGLLIASLTFVTDLFAQDLGNLSSNPYPANSSANQFGAGSPYNSNSINNPYGKYGSPYSNDSSRNPYATDAPKPSATAAIADRTSSLFRRRMFNIRRNGKLELTPAVCQRASRAHGGEL